jgi:hypothetical protein
MGQGQPSSRRIFTGIAFLVTVLFKADVTAQGGAYATGVLVLMGSAALAVTLEAWRHGRNPVGYFLLTLIFGYTTVVNIHEKPEGLKIASFFILAIVITSLVSRVLRSTELRVHAVEPDEMAAAFLKEAFVEVRPGDASEFSDRLRVSGVDIGGHHVLRCVSPAIPNAIAAVLLFVRDFTGKIPHAYFGWTEGNPIAYLLKFLAFGEGDTAPVTREVLRQTEPNPLRRPRIHVG